MVGLLIPILLFSLVSPIPALIWPTWLAQWWYGGPPTVRPPIPTAIEPETSPLPPEEAWKTFSEDDDKFVWQREAPSKSWRPIGAKFYPPSDELLSARMTNPPPAKVSAHFFEVIHFTKSIQRVTTSKPSTSPTDCTHTTRAEEKPVHSAKLPPENDPYAWRPSLFTYSTPKRNSTAPSTLKTFVPNTTANLPSKVLSTDIWSEEINETGEATTEEIITPEWSKTEPIVGTNIYQNIVVTAETDIRPDDEIPEVDIKVDQPIVEELSFRTDSTPEETPTFPAQPLEPQRKLDEALLTKSISIARTYPDRFVKSGVRYGFGFRFPSHMRPLSYGTSTTSATNMVSAPANFSERGIRYETGFRPMFFFKRQPPKTSNDNSNN